jgi:fucose 4-O-acetylase-like acetyltransferase
MSLISQVGQRDQALDALKGLAIVGVLFAHMNFANRLSETTLFWVGVIQQFFGWCVIAFFFCSGLLTRLEEHHAKAWVQYGLIRARRLLVPCLVFSLTYKCCLIALRQGANLGQPASLPSGNLFDLVEFLFAPVGPQFYFLPYLFMVSLASVLAVTLAKGTTVLCWVVFVVCAVFYIVQPAPQLTYGASGALIPGYCFSFWLGLMARQNWREHVVWWVVVFLSVLVGSAMRGTFSYAQFILPVVLYWSLRKVKVSEGLAFLGRKSGSVYVWHDPLLLPACSILAANLLPNEAMQVAVILGLGGGISILLGELVGKCSYLSYYRF